MVNIKDNKAITLLELLVVIMVIGITCGLIVKQYALHANNYELVIEAHELKSTIQMLQTFASRYYVQKKYQNEEWRDDDLWGILFNKDSQPYTLIRKGTNGNETVINYLPGPVYYNDNIYPSIEKKISYSLINRCSGDKIFFNALGKAVNSNGKQCDHDITISLLQKEIDQYAKIVIKRTGYLQVDILNGN